MTGFGVDPDALEGAINKLKSIHEDAGKLVAEAAQVKPGELTAGDAYTKQARLKMQDRATGHEGSLREVARQLQDKILEKIDAYEATLKEYRGADEHATVGHAQVDRQA